MCTHAVQEIHTYQYRSQPYFQLNTVSVFSLHPSFMLSMRPSALSGWTGEPPSSSGCKFVDNLNQTILFLRIQICGIKKNHGSLEIQQKQAPSWRVWDVWHGK